MASSHVKLLHICRVLQIQGHHMALTSTIKMRCVHIGILTNLVGCEADEWTAHSKEGWCALAAPLAVIPFALFVLSLGSNHVGRQANVSILHHRQGKVPFLSTLQSIRKKESLSTAYKPCLTERGSSSYLPVHVCCAHLWWAVLQRDLVTAPQNYPSSRLQLALASYATTHVGNVDITGKAVGCT